MDRSKERYKYVLLKAKKIGLPIRRISAIDGKALSKEKINKYVDENYQNYLGHYPKLGELGCSLSHIKAWKAFLASPFQFALIMEDDINFDPALLSTTIKLLTENKNLWDINNFNIVESQPALPLSVRHFSNINKDLVVYLRLISCAGAYMINRTAAQKLLRKALPIKMMTDYYFNRPWEFGLKFIAIEPCIVTQGFGDTTVHKTKYVTIKNSKPRDRWKKRILRWQTRLIKFVYNIKVYIVLKTQQFFTDK